MDVEQVRLLLDVIRPWAFPQPDIRGLALIGSWARGEARPDSDLDLMLLVLSPERYRKTSAWLPEIAWQSARFSLSGFRDAEYGRVWSRHVELTPFAEIELCFASCDWAGGNPLDPGTASVVRNGCRVLFDKDDLFRKALKSLNDTDVLQPPNVNSARGNS